MEGINNSDELSVIFQVPNSSISINRIFFPNLPKILSEIQVLALFEGNVEKHILKSYIDKGYVNPLYFEDVRGPYFNHECLIRIVRVMSTIQEVDYEVQITKQARVEKETYRSKRDSDHKPQLISRKLREHSYPRNSYIHKVNQYINSRSLPFVLPEYIKEEDLNVAEQ